MALDLALGPPTFHPMSLLFPSPSLSCNLRQAFIVTALSIMKVFLVASILSLACSATAAVIEPRLFNAGRFPRPSIDPFYALPEGLEALAKGEYSL